jgi:hypothetical protein
MSGLEANSSHCGCRVIASNQLKAAINAKGVSIETMEIVTGGGNNTIYKATDANGKHYAVKCYSHREAVENERLNREFSALAFLQAHNVTNVPCVHEKDLSEHFAIYDWIEGGRVKDVKQHHVDGLIDFLSQLKTLSLMSDAKKLESAKDACLSATDLLGLIQNRFDRLNHLESADTKVKQFVTHDCLQLYVQLEKNVQQIYQAHGVKLDHKIDLLHQTLSPSDYGFHNALETKAGELCFLDFEYFGWDDPVKMVSDFMWHPGQNVSDALKAYFRSKMETLFSHAPFFSVRLNALLPMYGLIWILISLNHFIPAVWEAKIAAGVVKVQDKPEILQHQFQSAKTIFNNILSTVWENS